MHLYKYKPESPVHQVHSLILSDKILVGEVMEVREEEMKYRGIFGIYRESYNIIFSWRKIFTPIILAYMLPLSLISLADTQVPTSIGTSIFDLLSSPFTTNYWLLQVTFTIYCFSYSLISTSAVVYSTACIYSGREVTFTMARKAIPKVFMRLIITSFSIFLVVSGYHVVTFLIFGLVAIVTALHPNNNVGMSVLFVVLVLYLMGLLYMAVVWQLACTVSVLEDLYGFQAMKRSNQLIKGKVVASTIILLKMGLLYYMLHKPLERVVMNEEKLGIVNRLAYGSVPLSLLVLLSLFERVVQTIIYFICKSYHGENVDKLDLSDHLQIYSKEDYYVPSKDKNFHVLKQLGLVIFLCIHVVSKIVIVCMSRLLFQRICVKSRFSL